MMPYIALIVVTGQSSNMVAVGTNQAASYEQSDLGPLRFELIIY